jgi:undecaprenyl-diphosphatase
MDVLLLVKALILGIVEGLTEFLPISSTGHLILAGQLLGFNDEKGKVFEVVIQLAAILAVCWEYRAKIGNVIGGLRTQPDAQRFALNLVVAFMPAAVLGFLFSKMIKAYLFNAVSVAIAFIVGGLVIMWVERRPQQPRLHQVEAMDWKDALKVGIAQCFALIPGTSRSGATIIGGMLFGLSRKTATEFSFFLAIPTMFAATAHEALKYHSLFSAQDIPMLAVGSVVSFISAFFAVRGLLRFVSSHNFMVFAWYRIVFGIVVLATYYFGWVQWVDA